MSAFGFADEHRGLFDAYLPKPSKADTMVRTIIQPLAQGGAGNSKSPDLGDWASIAAGR